MKHLKTISRAQIFGTGGGDLSLPESIILLLLSAYFSAWDNYSAVIQNLTKYYQKT